MTPEEQIDRLRTALTHARAFVTGGQGNTKLLPEIDAALKETEPTMSEQRDVLDELREYNTHPDSVMGRAMAEIERLRAIEKGWQSLASSVGAKVTSLMDAAPEPTEKPSGWYVGRSNPRNVWSGNQPVCHAETEGDALLIVVALRKYAVADRLAVALQDSIGLIEHLNSRDGSSASTKYQRAALAAYEATK